MNRVNWIKIISENFGDNLFSIKRLVEVTGKPRESVVRILHKHVKDGNIVRFANGMYKFGKAKRGGTDTLKTPRSSIMKTFIKELSKKYGDSTFSCDQAQEIAGTKRSSLHARMHSLKKGGFVKSMGTGLFSLTDKAHNLVVDDFKKDAEEERVKICDTEPKSPPSCILIKMENILGKDKMKDWVYSVAMLSEECVGILEEEAVKAIVRS